MKKAIIGGGGFAKEVKSYIKNETIASENIPMFVDNKYVDNDTISIDLFDPNEYEVVVAIGNPRDRFDVVQKLPENTKYFTYIHPTAQIINGVKIGKGSIICPGVIITTNVTIGNHCHLNLLTTIGHDCKIGSYFTTAPGAKISGNCIIYDCVYIGTNASVREKLSIHSFSTIGMNAAVVKNINESGIYVGVPAKKIR